MKFIVVTGSFDNITSRDIRFLEEAAKYGALQVLLWSDEAIQKLTGFAPRFHQKERKYFLDALRFVHKTSLVDEVANEHSLPEHEMTKPWVWGMIQDKDTYQKRQYCESHGIAYTVIHEDDIHGFPVPRVDVDRSPKKKKVLVTGCYDWLHTGHIRFFEETSQLGDLYVVVGHDKNIRLLKGEGHPMYSEDERRYMVGAICFVKQVLISSGSGWMDAEPEIQMIRPDIYAVNEDGNVPEKRAFCERNGLEYIVLKRTPAEGLPTRTSTNLRGF